jgi:ketosteroid isomerase-like protein
MPEKPSKSEDIARVRTTPGNLSFAGTLAILVLFFGPQPPQALGAEPQAGIKAGERAIRELVERRLVAAVNARDYEAVRAGLTDDWTYVTSAGRRRNFEDWKGLVQRYTELHVEFRNLRARASEDGRLAWATFCGRIQGEVDGAVDDREVLYTAIIEKTEDEWKLRHLQGTESSQAC